MTIIVLTPDVIEKLESYTFQHGSLVPSDYNGIVGLPANVLEDPDYADAYSLLYTCEIVTLVGEDETE